MNIKLHPASIAALVLALGGASLFFSGFIIVGSILLTLAPLSSMHGLKTNTRNADFAVHYIVGGAIATAIFFTGYAAGSVLHLAAVGTLLATCIAVLRIQFFGTLTHTRFNRLELAIAPVPTLIFLTGMAIEPLGWQVWMMGGIVLLAQLYSNIVQALDGLKIKDMASDGYEVERGEHAPDFLLENHRGETVKLNDFKDESHVLLLFVRGDWCPHCHMMLRNYSENIDAFEACGIHLVAIGPDPKGVNKAMVEKLGLEFDLCEDPNMELASRYGIRLRDYENDMVPSNQKPDYLNEGEGIPLPAAFLVNDEGIIAYTSRPDRVGGYMDPNKIYPALERLQRDRKHAPVAMTAPI